jgi:phosphate transport system substrate-binding protein
MMEMNMNKMGKLVLSALSVVGLAACAVSSTDEASVLGESLDALTGPDNKSFYGSDTLFHAMTDAITAAGLSSDLVYRGTGTGNGERCLRGTGTGTNPPGGYCQGTIGQAIAPMSRALNNIQPGEQNVGIAKDAVLAVTDADQTASGATLAAVKGAFCGDGDGDATSCADFNTWGEFTTGSSNPSAPIVLYRRDDASGTTDVFKSLTGCTNFCANVMAVVDDATAGPRLATDSVGTSSLTGGMSPVCSVSDSVTVCLGKLAASNVNVLAYAGLEALEVSGTKALSVNSVAPTPTNIRSGSYPLSRCLYLNRGTATPSAAESDLLLWIDQFGGDFEDILESHGFISCMDPTDPDYEPLLCTTCN